MNSGAFAPRARSGGCGVFALGFAALVAAPLAPRAAVAAPCPVLLPVVGEFSSGFGHRGRGFHPGVDLRAPAGTPVVAPVAGTVVFTGRFHAYGVIVDIEHRDGSRARYAHLSRIAPEVRVGATMTPGQQMGAVGRTGRTTGAHLHVELRRNGRAEDPWPWLTRTACLDDREFAQAR